MSKTLAMFNQLQRAEYSCGTDVLGRRFVSPATRALYVERSTTEAASLTTFRITCNTRARRPVNLGALWSAHGHGGVRTER